MRLFADGPPSFYTSLAHLSGHTRCSSERKDAPSPAVIQITPEVTVVLPA